MSVDTNKTRQMVGSHEHTPHPRATHSPVTMVKMDDILFLLFFLNILKEIVHC